MTARFNPRTGARRPAPAGVALALVLTAASGPALAQASLLPTADERVDAFVEGCLGGGLRPTFAATTARLIDAGWFETVGTAHPELATVLNLTAAGIDPSIPSHSSLFSTLLGGSTLFLILTQIDGPNFSLIACAVYDFEAALLPQTAPMTTALGRSPNTSTGSPNVGYGWIWEAPPAFESAWDVQMTYIPPGSTAVSSNGFDGLVFVTRWSPAPE